MRHRHLAVQPLPICRCVLNAQERMQHTIDVPCEEYKHDSCRSSQKTNRKSNHTVQGIGFGDLLVHCLKFAVHPQPQPGQLTKPKYWREMGMREVRRHWFLRTSKHSTTAVLLSSSSQLPR